MAWFNSLTLKKKLLVYSIIISAIVFFEGVMALNGINQIGNKVEGIYSDNLIPIVDIDEILDQAMFERVSLFQHIGSTNLEEMNILRNKMEENRSKINSLLENENSYNLSADENKLFQKLAPNFNSLFASYDKALELSDGFSKEDAFTIAVTKTVDVYDEITTTIQDIDDKKVEKARESHAKSQIIENTNWWTMLFLVLGGIAAVLIISFFTAKSITDPIINSVSALTSSSSQISTTIDEQKHTAAKQSTAVDQTTATMQELSASSQQSAEQAEVTAAGAMEVQSLAEQGAVQVAQNQHAAETLKEKVREIAEKILRLSEQTGQIQNIINLVSDIANQTNLLALNAAVEAARAGEHGRGFGVVAVEIRKLADESKKSAEKIANLVSDIQRATNSTVMATEEGTKTVEKMTEISQGSANILDKIATAAGSASESIQQILGNTKQQATGIKHVVEAMDSINTGARETVDGITQTKFGIQKINEVSEKLAKMV